jgi:hypothetical protein
MALSANTGTHLLFYVAWLASAARIHARTILENKLQPRTVIIPVPATTEDVRPPVASPRGRCETNVNPPAEFWSNEEDPSSWPDVRVPA